MKKQIFILLTILTLVINCEKRNVDLNGQITDGFCIRFGESYIINHKSIDYYDFSTHLIYLKKGNDVLNIFENGCAFFVYANKELIYSGKVIPSYSSFLPTGAVIYTTPSFYNDYVIPISCNIITNFTGNENPDPRNDNRIVASLKRYNQFHEGLNCTIKSIAIADNKASIELNLTNKDKFNYFYLDPEKMGVGLYHYFTNGLFIVDLTSNKRYTHKIIPIGPVPWDTWKKDWFSLINSGEAKTIRLTYENFESVPTGNYKAFFTFPGLNYSVDKEDISFSNGRIWLGELSINQEIAVK